MLLRQTTNDIIFPGEVKSDKIDMIFPGEVKTTRPSTKTDNERIDFGNRISLWCTAALCG